MNEARPTVLLVEDDELGLRMVTVMLERKGYHVLPARDGREAMSVLERNRPDVILLDLMMPRMNGFQFLRALADREGEPIPVVVVSAKAEPVDRHWAERLGARDFVAKPFTNSSLLGSVQRALEAQMV